jgi:hypothetical protein
VHVDALVIQFFLCPVDYSIHSVELEKLVKFEADEMRHEHDSVIDDGLKRIESVMD